MPTLPPAPISPADLNRANALPLLLAFDDHNFPDRERALGKLLVRLTYLQGLDSLVLGSRTALAELAGIGKNHFAEILRALVTKNVILVHEGSDVVRVRTDVHNWDAPALCPGGHEHARRQASKLVRMHYDAVHQVDMAEIDASFARWLTLNDGLALHSQEEGAQLHWPFDLRPPGPGAAGGVVPHNPPGPVIQDAAAAGPKEWSQEWVRDQVRRSLESTGPLHQPTSDLVPETGTASDALSGADAVPKRGTGTVRGGVVHNGSPAPVPKTGTGSGRANVLTGWETPEEVETIPKTGTPRRSPQNGDSPRARASESSDHLSSGQDHLPNRVQRTSSDDQGDDRRGDERSGATEKWQMVPVDDELFGDLRRELGENLGSFSDDWRRAIFLSWKCVYEALAALKLNRRSIRKHPGGFLRTCFLNECAKRGVELPPDLFPIRRVRQR